MMSLRLIVTFMMLSFTPHIEADEKKPDELIGKWVFKSIEVGDKQGKPVVLPQTWEIKDGEITIDVIMAKEIKAVVWTFKIDANKEPKEIDITADFDTTKGILMKGIYKIDKE
jgi:uncharacterized protein (TIGR03067 family)